MVASRDLLLLFAGFWLGWMTLGLINLGALWLTHKAEPRNDDTRD